MTRMRRKSGRDPRSIGRHIIFLAATTSGAAALLLVLLVQVLLADVSTSAADRVLRAETERVTAAIDDASTGSRLTVPEAAVEPGVVVYDDRENPIAGRAPTALSEVYPELAAAAPEVRTIDDGHRVHAVALATSSGARGVVVVSSPMEPYEQTERYALLITIGAGAVLVLSSVVVAAWVTRRVLRPVGEMARTAEEWSERDLTRRFDLGPPNNELTGLARILDGLLDKVAHAIRTEQRLTAELAHELRTPLTAIQGNAELIELRGGLDPETAADVAEIREACRRMTDVIATLLELARAPASRTAADSTRLDDLATEVRAHSAGRLATSPGLVVDLVPSTPDQDPSEVLIDAPLNLVVRAVLPVVDNALRIGSQVRLVLEVGDQVVGVHVDDDGPGVPAEFQPRLFEPGQSSGGGGAGLGLALSRRVARGLGGDVVLGRVDDAPYRTRFTIELPRAQRNTNRR